MTEKKLIKLSKSYTTINGVELKNPVAAYEEYGRPDGPVVLLCHGGLSSQHAADVTAEEPNPGWWDKLVGPENVFDTNVYRILSVNALGSLFGTTSALTVNPDTGKAYGKDFPYITLEDQARFLKMVLEELGVEKVFWAAGLSMGSLTILNLAVLYPEFVGALTPVATAAYMTAGGMVYHNAIMNGLRLSPNWNGGDYDEGILPAIMAMAQVNKVYFSHYSLFENMVEGITDQNERERKLDEYVKAGNEAYARSHDPNGMITCLRACNSYNLARGYASLDEAFARLNMPMLVINVDSDGEFPPKYGKEIVDGVNAHYPGNAEHVIIHSINGHLGCVTEGEQLKEAMMPFKQRLLK
ncbi:MAG: alpha/beta fold hydrolase [Coprococcus sp.]